MANTFFTRLLNVFNDLRGAPPNPYSLHIDEELQESVAVVASHLERYEQPVSTIAVSTELGMEKTLEALGVLWLQGQAERVGQPDYPNIDLGSNVKNDENWHIRTRGKKTRLWRQSMADQNGLGHLVEPVMSIV